MSIPTIEQKAAKQEALKAKMEAGKVARTKPVRQAAADAALQAEMVAHGADPNDVKSVKAEVLPPLSPRDRFGRYLPGCNPRPFGGVKDAVAPTARHFIKKHSLWEKLSQMAAAQGKYKDIEPSAQLKAIGMVFDRAYGTPIQMVLETNGAEATYTIKRIVGVDDTQI
jgi:hypothetical protein